MPDCQTCNQLWRDLATKTDEHIRKRSEQETAAAKGSWDWFRTLDQQVVKADAARQEARQAIAEHEREHH